MKHLNYVKCFYAYECNIWERHMIKNEHYFINFIVFSKVTTQFF
jgi:hypothetical protein